MTAKGERHEGALDALDPAIHLLTFVIEVAGVGSSSWALFLRRGFGASDWNKAYEGLSRRSGTRHAFEAGLNSAVSQLRSEVVGQPTAAANRQGLSCVSATEDACGRPQLCRHA
jgi:hypothetical protein